MINDTAFTANITIYRNYLERPNNWYKTPVATLSIEELLVLLKSHYENSGNFIYEIDKQE